MLKEGIPAQKFSDMSNLRPGDIKYKDLNGDGEVTAVDKTAIGGTRITRDCLWFWSYSKL